eukprot:scaffold218343_cov30-Tisochrysis_lutea.AAC.1
MGAGRSGEREGDEPDAFEAGKVSDGVLELPSGPELDRRALLPTQRALALHERLTDCLARAAKALEIRRRDDTDRCQERLVKRLVQPPSRPLSEVWQPAKPTQVPHREALALSLLGRGRRRGSYALPLRFVRCLPSTPSLTQPQPALISRARPDSTAERRGRGEARCQSFLVLVVLV